MMKPRVPLLISFLILSCGSCSRQENSESNTENANAKVESIESLKIEIKELKAECARYRSFAQTEGTAFLGAVVTITHMIGVRSDDAKWNAELELIVRSLQIKHDTDAIDFMTFNFKVLRSKLSGLGVEYLKRKKTFDDETDQAVIRDKYLAAILNESKFLD